MLLGQGDGTFQAPLTSPAGLGPAYMAVGDFNGDGVADVAVTSGANAVSVLQGNGDGTFQAPLMFAAGFGAVAIAVSDFNDDGTPDLAVADWGLNNVSVLINNTPWPCHRHGRHCRGHRDLTWFRGPLTPWAPGVLDGREDTPTLPTGVSASDGPPGARGSEAGGT